MRRKSSNAKA